MGWDGNKCGYPWQLQQMIIMRKISTAMKPVLGADRLTEFYIICDQKTGCGIKPFRLGPAYITKFVSG
jgi:hypothetical protein